MDPYVRLKEATRWMWALGDYGEIAGQLEPHAEALATAAGVQPGMEVLDVAAGNGNFAIAATRRGARVTATDLSPKMIELGRSRTDAANLEMEWCEADAEDLPFADKRFDIVASVFGAMFAPRPERVATDLFRLVKPGGVVAMANDSKPGFLGSFTEGWIFWERTNPPLIALKSMLLVDGYQEVVEQGKRLMREVNAATDGQLVLDSKYLQVVARKGLSAT